MLHSAIGRVQRHTFKDGGSKQDVLVSEFAATDVVDGDEDEHLAGDTGRDDHDEGATIDLCRYRDNVESRDKGHKHLDNTSEVSAGGSKVGSQLNSRSREGCWARDAVLTGGQISLGSVSSHDGTFSGSGLAGNGSAFSGFGGSAGSSKISSGGSKVGSGSSQVGGACYAGFKRGLEGGGGSLEALNIGDGGHRKADAGGGEDAERWRDTLASEDILTETSATANDGQAGEGREGQRGVLGRARNDELSSQSEDCIGAERSREWVRGTNRTEADSLDGSVERLHPENGASNTENVLALDERSSTEIGRSADGLEDGRQGNERGNVGDREVVVAGKYRLKTSSQDGLVDDVDVGCFIRGNELQIQEEIVVEPCIQEILQGEDAQGMPVKGILQMLQREGKLENGDINLAQTTAAAAAANVA